MGEIWGVKGWGRVGHGGLWENLLTQLRSPNERGEQAREWKGVRGHPMCRGGPLHFTLLIIPYVDQSVIMLLKGESFQNMRIIAQIEDFGNAE